MYDTPDNVEHPIDCNPGCWCRQPVDDPNSDTLPWPAYRWTPPAAGADHDHPATPEATCPQAS